MSAGVWAIVPVKPFGHAKSRLAAVLSPEARAGLSRAFFAHALGVLAGVPEVERVVVISQDSAALQSAREQGALALAEDGAPDLNRALTRATEAAVAGGAAAILILPTDLPLMSVGDVRDLIIAEADGPAVTLAPDQHDAGTNALLVRPPGLLAYAFGEGSFARHLARAQAAGAAVRVVRRPGLALDVDRPEDLAVYRAAHRAAPQA